MPIDFAAIAAGFRPAFRSQTEPVAAALVRLGRWISARFERVQALDRATQEFPIVRFYNEALTAYVDRSQHGSLGRASPVEPTLSSSGRAFVAGVARTGTAISESLLLPRLLGLVQSFLNLVVASLDRFSRATPQMFDPRRRTASDLFGEVGLLYRAIATSTRQVQTFTRGVDTVLRTFRSQESTPAPAPGAAAGGAQPAPPTPDLPTRLDGVARNILGAVLALTLLPVWLMRILTAVDTALRSRVVTTFTNIQNRLFRMRRALIDFVAKDLMEMLREAFVLVTVMLRQVILDFGFFTRFAILYGHELLSSIHNFLARVSGLINIVIDVIQAIRDAIRAILEFNLTPILLAPLGVPGWLLSQYAAPDFTVADLLNVAADVGIVSTRAALEGWLNTVETLTFPASLLLRRQLNAIREILRATLRPLERLPAPPSPPSLAGVRFPNLFDAFFGPGASDFFRALRSARDRLLTDIPTILNSVRAFLRDVSRLFGRAAAGAANLGSLERYQTIAERAGRLADTVYGDQVTDLRRRIAERRPDAFAQAFEGWLIHGGFNLVGEVIPLYVDHMFRYWQTQVAPEEAEPATGQAAPSTPTSPHILARRARLGRVQMERLTIRAPARLLDDALVATIAGSFRGAVAQAYASGERTLASRVA
jgi:hypothetical protein